MNKRRERTLQDISDASVTVPKPEAKSETNKDFSSCADRSQKIDYTDNSGACNVCAARCSSCLHVRKVLMSSTDESAGETCAESVVVDRGQQLEIGKPGDTSTVARKNSHSDCLSENAVGKASSRTSDADTSASDDNVVHSKFDGQRAPVGHGDYLSCVSGTDEHANTKSVSGDMKIMYSRQGKTSGESSDNVPSNRSLPCGLSSQDSGLMEIPPLKSTDDATDSMKVNNTFLQALSGKSVSQDLNLSEAIYDKPSGIKDGFMQLSSEPLISLPEEEVELDVFCTDPPLKSIEKNDDMEVEIQPTDETDDSDVVEEDVKVCDICGDAGQEEKLAICCQCSDGAEHIYCMRERLDKVPEGEWLCEECRDAERIRHKKHGKLKKVDEYGKNNSSGHASSDANSSEIDGHRTKGYMKKLGKRLRDDADAEVSSVVKKPFLESVTASPKTSVSSKTSGLSREYSSKNLDKGRLKASRHSSDAIQVNYAPESARTASDLREKNFQGTFSKSNSFNSLNSKPKVKLVNQVVLQRQRSARERVPFFRLKEGAARSIGKSLSFKSVSNVRTESKIETSPRVSYTCDLKSMKRSSFERQSSFKTEHSSLNPTMGTSTDSMSRDKNLQSRDLTSSLTNHHKMKPLQADGKSAALSRSSILAAQKNADLSSPKGEFKRPSQHSRSTLGVSLANGVNNNERKYNQISPKMDFSSCSAGAEKPSFNNNECQLDISPQPSDFASSNQQERDTSGSHSRPTFVKSSRDENNNLKAALEVAALKKPGVYRKHRALGQSDNSSVSSIGCEVVQHQNHLSNIDGKKINSSSAEMPERLMASRNSTALSVKIEALDHVKQISLVPVRGLPFVRGEGFSVASLDGKSSFTDVPAAMPSYFKSLTIPEHEYIWQGSFEICRSVKIVDVWNGLQAHLSTCASPKVVEAVNKFNNIIILDEVPRITTWPIQFQEHGATEDNIALFFFAKDLENYEKIYKVLLDNMMKNDLALRGNVDGVELLIFPSNQLPDDAQRWNKLFFLWAVLRGKHEICLQAMPESVNHCSASREITPTMMSLPESACPLQPITKDLPTSENATRVPKGNVCEKFQSFSLNVVNGDCDTKMPSLNCLDSKLNPKSSAIEIDGGKQCGELETFQALSSTSCSATEEMQTRLESPLDRQRIARFSNKDAADIYDMALMEEIDERQGNSKMQFSLNAENHLKEERDVIDLNIDYNKQLLDQEEYVHPRSPRTLDPDSQVLARVDDTCDKPSVALERMNHVATGSPCILEHEARDEMDIPSGEKRLFPVKSQSVKSLNLVDRSIPWKMRPLEQDRLRGRAPSLELALGAETKPLIQSLLVDNKIKDENIFDEAMTKAEDDVSASLSLSLSFPSC